jgi:hypothetical protein
LFDHELTYVLALTVLELLLIILKDHQEIIQKFWRYDGVDGVDVPLQERSWQPQHDKITAHPRYFTETQFLKQNKTK